MVFIARTPEAGISALSPATLRRPIHRMHNSANDFLTKPRHHQKGSMLTLYNLGNLGKQKVMC